MTPPDDDLDYISVVEDLDPEPAGGRGMSASGGLRLARTFDLALGLVLLVCVLGWSGFTWWRDETNRGHYRQAQNAASLHFLKQPILRYRRAGISDARQSRGVQFLVLLDERVDCQTRTGWQPHERFRAIDDVQSWWDNDFLPALRRHWPGAEADCLTIDQAASTLMLPGGIAQPASAGDER